MSEKKNDVFDLDGIRLLVELMKENDVSELDLEQSGSRLSLRRAQSGFAVVDAKLTPACAPVAAVPTAPTPTQPVDVPTPREENAANVKTIKSPMVGTFYSSPSPDAPPFVQVGDSVTPDKTVCIIEAMKIFNDVPAELSGTIVEILAKSGDPVEFGTPLFKVEQR